MKKSIYLFSMLCLFIACDKNRVFEENTDIKAFEWTYENKLNYEVAIQDIIPKNMYINFRHTFYFETRNVRLKLDIKNPKGEISNYDINIPLAEPNGMWYGDCAGDICDVQYMLKEFSNYSFPDTGVYVFSLYQDMRVNPLPDVMSAGIRIENAKSIESN